MSAVAKGMAAPSYADAGKTMQRYRKTALLCTLTSVTLFALVGGPALAAVMEGDDEFTIQHVEGGQVENAFVDDARRNEGYLTVRYQVGDVVYRLTDRITDQLGSCSAREEFIRRHYPCSRWPTVRYSPGHPENATLVDTSNRSWAPLVLIGTCVVVVPLFLCGLYFGFRWLAAPTGSGRRVRFHRERVPDAVE